MPVTAALGKWREEDQKFGELHSTPEIVLVLLIRREGPPSSGHHLAYYLEALSKAPL